MYTLRVPFQLVSTQKINLDETFIWERDGLDFELRHDRPYYALTVQGFLSQSDAKEYMLKVQSGLFWILLNRGFAFEAEWDLDDIVFAADPDAAARNVLGEKAEGPVHGFIDANLPAVYPSNKTLLKSIIYPPQFVSGHTVDAFQKLLHDGMEIRHDSPITYQSRLWTALDLYNAYYFERSNNARLLTLVMALEALSEPHYKHQRALDLISEWQTQIDTRREEIATESSDRDEAMASLDALERELLFRKEASLRSQVRTLVRTTLEGAGNPKATEIVSRVLKVYDERSKLSHEGTLPTKRLKGAVSEARKIVEIVLVARFRFEDS